MEERYVQLALFVLREETVVSEKLVVFVTYWYLWNGLVNLCSFHVV